MSLAVEQLRIVSYDRVNPKDYVERGTLLHTIMGFVVCIVVLLFSILVSYGIALVIWLIAGLLYSSNTKKAWAQLAGSSLQVGPQQFPEIYETCRRMSERLGLKECPDIYIIEDNKHNAFAMKRGGKHSVILIDDIVFGAEATGNMQALDFIIGHELAHHALGHTRGIRSLISGNYKALSRLDEFSCDAVASALVDNSRAAQDAFCLLLVGPQLFSKVNKEALHQQALEVVSNKYSKKAEVSSTHPLLLRRYGRVLAGR